ncbi:MAG: ABC transporter substrate-binding protein [Spiribacter sp.]|jgi:putative thiamine transport system substrate-binding protein|nr:ABC transporter substrate-binding protein [Spiribacter sp.]MDR9489703.1 ABC transporter substrate-binding protein [Spiribacter sp.]
MSRWFFILILMLLSSLSSANNWERTLEAAEGQTVYWHAWGGDERTNAFIRWAGRQTAQRYGVNIQQVKLSDTAEAVSRVLAEKAAGIDKGGAVDLLWVNGPNFLAMKEQNLLHGPFVRELPNSRYLDLSKHSANQVDFTEPVEGLESPWRLARFVFIYDSEKVLSPPTRIEEFIDWAKANPGRFTHPSPTNFMGATFLKQALIELTDDPSLLQQPVNEARFAKASAPLWRWYEALRPYLWREGESFPSNESVQKQMLSDGQIDIAMAFDPAAAAAGIKQGLLPKSARVFVPSGGSLGNVSFVAIPYNAAHKAGAKVVANFLLKPSTQAHMQNINVLGAFSVLDPKRLDASAKTDFDALPKDPALPSRASLGPTLNEPHASWMTRLKQAWAERYTQ